VQAIGHHLQRDIFIVYGFDVGENVTIRPKTILPKKHMLTTTPNESPRKMLVLIPLLFYHYYILFSSVQGAK
jgi:hypothetical protein